MMSNTKFGWLTILLSLAVGCGDYLVPAFECVEPGLPCDDENKCTINDACDSKGTCSGKAVVCDTPPANLCSQDDTVSTQYENTGTCNPTTGLCEYDYDDIACADCGHQCLGLPYAPGNLVASAGDAQVTLTWDGIDGARSYNVYVSQTTGDAANAVPVSAASSPHVHAGLSNGTTYYFAVAAVSEEGEGYLSGEVSATPRLSAPVGVSAQGGVAEVTLTWDSVPGADTYNVYWTLQAGVTLNSNQVIGVTSPFVHAPLTSSTTYFYALTAVDGPSESALSDEVSAATFTLIDTGTKLVAPDAQAADEFGYSVALSGDYAIVGARLEDGGDGDPLVSAGAAYVFHRTGENTWDTGSKLVAPDAQANDRFGSSVALSGDYAIVGATYEAGGDGDPLVSAGAAYVFKRTGENTWDTGTKLVAPDAQAYDNFGYSVALSGDYAIVGALGENGGDGGPMSDAGAAYVFKRTGENTWDVGTKLVAPDAQAKDGFGWSVALSGHYAVVGAVGEDGGDGDPMSSAGAAYVFKRTGENTWDTGTKLVAPDAQAYDNFGYSVALSGDYAIVGALGENGGDGDPESTAGAAYVFHRTGENTWDVGTKLVAPDAQTNDRFGSSVALSGGYAIVGAYYEDGGDSDSLPNAGAAYVYEY